MSGFKNLVLAGAIALGTSSCSDETPLGGYGDDLDRPYDLTIKTTECNAKTKNETAIILTMGIVLDKGDYKTPLLTRLVVDIPGGGNYTFRVINKFGQFTGKIFSSTNPNQTHLVEEGDQIVGSVFTTNPGVKPKIELFTTDPNFGKETKAGEYRSTCEKKNLIAYKAVCFEVTTNNHCEGSGIINGLVVSEPTTLQGNVTLIGMQASANQPIIVTIKGTNGERRETIKPVGSVPNQTFPFSFLLRPGDNRIEFRQGTTQPIPLSNTKSMNITFNNRETIGLNQPTLVIKTGDVDCTKD